VGGEGKRVYVPVGEDVRLGMCGDGKEGARVEGLIRWHLPIISNVHHLT